MFKFNFKFVLPALAAIVFVAAGASSQTLEIPSGEWRLAELNGRNADDTKAYIDIDVNAARITGSAGCNRLFGSVAGGKGKIRFSKIGTTRMACADASAMRTETQFLNALRRTTRYSENGRTLSLFAGRRVVAKFTAVRRMPPEEPPASGPESMKWMLASIGGKKVSKHGSEAFISFDAEKHSAGGNTSCNVFGGSYTSKGEKLRVTEVIATMRACIEDDRMTIERQFLDALEKTDRYEIAGNKLTLFHGREPLLGFRGEAK